MGHPTPTVSAYTAGLIDGEGCISIGKQNRAGRWKQYNLAVIVVSKSPKLTDWLYGHWGGYRGTVARKHGFSPGVYHRWSVSAHRAQELLKDILPYLRLKDDQARIAIEFQIIKGHYPSYTGHSMGDRYEPYYQRLRAAKHDRAAAETEHPSTDNGEATVQPLAKAE